MSDTFLRFTPGDPIHVPSESSRRELVRLMTAGFPDADGVHEQEHDEVTFVDAGSNFEVVGCPTCGKELDSGWWGDAMGAAGDSGFADLSVTLPCCAAKSSLNDLRYEMPQAFARYVLEVVNPNVDDVPASLLGKLSQRLGSNLRVVWTRV